MEMLQLTVPTNVVVELETLVGLEVHHLQGANLELEVC